jgi:hypothetical protein
MKKNKTKKKTSKTEVDEAIEEFECTTYLWHINKCSKFREKIINLVVEAIKKTK